jgi:hypothetical protein
MNDFKVYNQAKSIARVVVGYLFQAAFEQTALGQAGVETQ